MSQLTILLLVSHTQSRLLHICISARYIYTQIDAD